MFSEVVIASRGAEGNPVLVSFLKGFSLFESLDRRVCG